MLAVYMAPEYLRGQLSTKVDAYAFGLVIVEALTGYPVMAPMAGWPDLMALFEEDLGSPDQLAAHLDKRASWHQHKERVAVLHDIADRCLESRRSRRPEVCDIIAELEEVRRGAAALPEAAADPGRECDVCLQGDAEISGWVMLRPCGHVCVCRECAVGLAACPKCRQAVVECINAYLN
jgi:serine/threonine protein kinase